MNKKHLIILCALFISSMHAQYNNKDGNRIGFFGGVNHMSVMGTNFDTKPGIGWTAGFQVRGNLYNDWSGVFGINFFESSFDIQGTNKFGGQEDVHYKMNGGQLKFLFSYNIIDNHLSFDIGPMLQFGDKLKIKKNQEEIALNNTYLVAKDIVDITKINGNIFVGVSGGIKRVKLLLNYTYGVNNFMNKLNKDEFLYQQNNGEKFKGHFGMASAQLLVNL